ncbi:MAG: gluconate 2-dehydrogenase subunit 3 family protein [Terriglobia bacterium]
MSDKNNEKPMGSLNRRDWLKVISLAPAVAVAPGLAARALAAPLSGDAPETPGAPYQPKALNPHQWKTLSILCGLIIPADDRSGSATQAGVPEFIDDFVNLRGEKVQTMLSGGLAWLDWRCNQDYANDFANCTAAQQTAMLDRIADREKAKPEDAFGAAFFMELRGLIMEGFYTSKLGIQDLQYMGNQMVADWEGCPENVTSRLGVNYSHWEHWKS